MSQADQSAPDDLLAAMNNEIQSYRQLLVLTQRERDVLLSGDLAAVASVVRDKEGVIRSLAEHEVARSHLTADLALALGLPADAGLQALIGRLGEPHAWALHAVRQECLGLVGQIEMLNRGNNGLIQSRLERIEATLDFVARATHEGDAPYAPCGNSTLSTNTGQVLNWQI